MPPIKTLNKFAQQPNIKLTSQQSVKKLQKILQQSNCKLQLNEIPQIQQSKHSKKQNGIICSYAVNTHQGNIRNYNEDRVTIILNIVKPKNKIQSMYWPVCSYFAIYDGHRGVKCAEFLRDKLHQTIINDDNFPQYPKKAIIQSIYKLEQQFLESSLSQKQVNKSGSCLIMILFIDKMCYIVNVGDSRAILVKDTQQIINLSQDHKPNLEIERKRIYQNGGYVYQQQIQNTSLKSLDNVIMGPHRLFPGRLSLSRSIGDIDAKFEQLGGNSKCLICKPDIKQIEITEKDSFILLGCDGIFDKNDNKDIIQAIYKTKLTNNDFHQYSADCIDNLLQHVLMSQSLDNLSLLMISFKDFQNRHQSLKQNCMMYKNDNSQQLNEISFSIETDDSLIKELDNDLQIQFFQNDAQNK